MKKIKIYIHKEGERTPELIEVSENANVRELYESGNGSPVISKEYEFSYEDADGPLEPGISLKDAGIGNKHHIHCHRCKKIDVTITYVSGESKILHVQPGLTIHQLIKRVAHQLHIDPSVVPTLVLKTETNDTLL